MTQALAIDMENKVNFREKLANETDLQYTRAVYKGLRAHWNHIKPPIKSVEDKKIAGVNCRIYQQEPNQPTKLCILYSHGGGWLVGDLDTHDRICRNLALNSGCDLIAVDYDLAPEIQHPKAILQIYDVYKSLRKKYGKIITAGDSAGAHMVIAMDHYCQMNNTQQADGIMVFYGAFGLMDSPSMRAFGMDDYYGLSMNDMEKYVNYYLGHIDAVKIAHDPLFNLLGNDLSKTPPCLIISAAYDSLRDDSRALHEILSHHNIANRYIEYSGVVHGFLHYSSLVPQAQEAILEACEFVKNIEEFVKCSNSGLSMNNMVKNALAQVVSLSPNDAIKAINQGEYQLIDLRDIRELWREGTIKGSYHAPRCMIEFWCDPQSPYYKPIFAKEKKYILFCAGGLRSALAAQTMQAMGFPHIAHISGGFGGFAKAGGEIIAVPQG